MSLSVCLSAVWSRLYLKDFSSDRFQIYMVILHILKIVKNCKKLKMFLILKIYEDLVHFRLNVHFCPGCFSMTIHRIVFKFYILTLQILKICNVVVLIENVENCHNYLFLKIYEDLVRFRLNVHFCPSCFSKTIHRIVFKFYILFLQILKMFNVVVLIDKIENCQNYRILKINEVFVHFRISVHFVQAVSQRLFFGSFSNSF